MTSANRQRRKNLLAASPYCWYCGIPVYDRSLETGWQPADQATLEHLVSKRNPMRRGDSYGIRFRSVLACYTCNNDRGAWTGMLIQAEEKRRREEQQAWAPTISQLVMMRT